MIHLEPITSEDRRMGPDPGDAPGGAGDVIPLLEFDPAQSAVLDPTHEALGLHLPPKCVFAFLGEYIDEYARARNARQVAEFVSATKRFPIYIVTHQGEEVVLCQAPVGAAPAAQLLDWLIGYGVGEIISAGSCGALRALPEGVFLVPCRALRDEGASYHYAPPSRYIEIDQRARTAIEKTVLEHGLKYQEVLTWSTDGFYRETRQKVESRRREGCAVVEMECAALAAVAAFRGEVWGMLLYTADSLADVERYDARSWGGNAYEYALTLCLDAVCKLP